MTSASRGGRIGLVACVTTKRSVTTAAKDLYDSALLVRRSRILVRPRARYRGALERLRHAR